MSTREGMQHITFLEVDEAPRDWPFKGPPAIREVLMAARTAREEFAGFHDFWIWASGAKPDSPVAIKRWDLLAVLRHALSFDQLNLGQLSSAEMAARLVLQIHQAVETILRTPTSAAKG